MKHATETIATLDTSLAPLCYRRWWPACRVRRSEPQRSVRSVAVVVVHEDGEDLLEVLSIQNQQPVETLRPKGAHEPLRDSVCLRGVKGRTNDPDPLASKHLIKTVSEYVSVTHITRPLFADESRWTVDIVMK